MSFVIIWVFESCHKLAQNLLLSLLSLLSLLLLLSLLSQLSLLSHRYVLITLWYSKGHFFTNTSLRQTDRPTSKLLELLGAAKNYLRSWILIYLQVINLFSNICCWLFEIFTQSTSWVNTLRCPCVYVFVSHVILKK